MESMADIEGGGWEDDGWWRCFCLAVWVGVHAGQGAMERRRPAAGHTIDSFTPPYRAV
jgi:hypothetical protein